MSRPVQVVLDDRRTRRCVVYADPIECIVAHSPVEVESALLAMQAAQAQGRYLAGYLSYELGYALEPIFARSQPTPDSLPLLWFGVFATPPRELDDAEDAAIGTDGRVYAGPLQFEWSENDYRAHFAAIRERIAAGDIFQANLSFRARFSVVGSEWALYRQLRSAADVAYAAYIDDGDNAILSFSPELFFEVLADGTLRTRPMKGTAPRSEVLAEDEALREALRNSAKNRAENLMIVDLMRNDLGRIAATGSVAAERLFDVDTFATVHQMTSTVSATLLPGTSTPTLLRALFPPGSVTGAPKIRAMQLLREEETSPRGVYCGAIGRLHPDGTSTFNVAIRTLHVRDGRGELGCGGAVVADSDAADEYAECLVKTRFLSTYRRPLRLLESIRCEHGVPQRIERHLQRMQASAQRFGLPFDRHSVVAACMRVANAALPLQRVRIVLDEDGAVEATAEPLADSTTPWRFVVATTRLHSADELLRHKTDWRELYDNEAARARAQYGCDEVLFLNERDELCEGARSNLFLHLGGTLLTPASSSGLLNGCLRQEWLAQGRCHEATLRQADLLRASQIYFGNSVRGLIAAEYVGPRHPFV